MDRDHINEPLLGPLLSTGTRRLRSSVRSRCACYFLDWFGLTGSYPFPRIELSSSSVASPKPILVRLFFDLVSPELLLPVICDGWGP